MPDPPKDPKLPYGYSSLLDEEGIAYYANHLTKTTQWLHPGKLKALQDAGIVPVSGQEPPFLAEDFDSPDFPVPPPWERKTDQRGRVYYANHDAKTTAWFHPTAVARANEGVAAGQGAFVAKTGAYGTGGSTALNLADEEERYTSKGEIPPWILEEKTIPPVGSGLEPKPYWVNYRTGSRYTLHSPLDRYEKRRRIRAAREQRGLPANAEEAEEARSQLEGEKLKTLRRPERKAHL